MVFFRIVGTVPTIRLCSGRVLSIEQRVENLAFKIASTRHEELKDSPDIIKVSYGKENRCPPVEPVLPYTVQARTIVRAHTWP
jgi:hypothetical protein